MVDRKTGHSIKLLLCSGALVDYEHLCELEQFEQ